MLRLSVILAFFAISMSSTSWAANWNSGNNEAKQSTQSNKFVSRTINIFVPDPVLEQFKKADLSQKKKFCDAQPSVWQKISTVSKSPPQRIKGFNSRMDNGNQVEGNQASLTFYLNMSEAFPDAMVNDDHREFILNQLYKWAEAGALTKTANCFASGSCGKSWKRSDGQDPYPGHDINHSLLRGHFLAFGYFASMPSYLPDDPKHLVIQKWLTSFLTDAPAKSRRSRYMDTYKWGLLLKGDINSGTNKDLAGKILKSSFEHLNEDGSIEDHTNRGNRALWYHSSGLNQIIINMEIARKYNIKIPEEMHERVKKSGEIFINGFKDHAFMDKWASQGNRGKYVKGSQDYKRNLTSVTGGVSWWYIFQYRYPNSPIAAELRRLTFQNPRTQDNLLGFGIGCIYRSLLPFANGLESNFNTAILKSSKVPLNKNQSGSLAAFQFSSANARIIDDKDDYLSFRIKLIKSNGNKNRPNVDNIKVMIDFEGKSKKESGEVKALRLEIPSDDYLNPSQAKAVLSCKKATIKKKGDKLVAYRLYSGNDAEANDCALSTMTEAGRKEAESLLATVTQIFANENVKKSDPYGVLEKHSKFLMETN